ncbi:hypothetical protein KBB05_03725 [Patescibacteria group bacterium]|nr:hypothetical protein [Patescibacteria group bacterium]
MLFFVSTDRSSNEIDTSVDKLSFEELRLYTRKKLAYKLGIKKNYSIEKLTWEELLIEYFDISCIDSCLSIEIGRDNVDSLLTEDFLILRSEKKLRSGVLMVGIVGVIDLVVDKFPFVKLDDRIRSEKTTVWSYLRRVHQRNEVGTNTIGTQKINQDIAMYKSLLSKLIDSKILLGEVFFDSRIFLDQGNDLLKVLLVIK